MGLGNNPAPIKEQGVCCDDCNKQYVIPKRFELLIKREQINKTQLNQQEVKQNGRKYKHNRLEK